MGKKTDESEIVAAKNRQIQTFGEWLANAGLSPLDYELVEERGKDGKVVWYYAKRAVVAEIDHSDDHRPIN